MMTREEILQRIEALEKQIFMIHMIDHWTFEDSALVSKLQEEVRQLKKQLA